MRKFKVCLCLFALVHSLELRPAVAQSQNAPQDAQAPKNQDKVKDPNKPPSQSGSPNQATADQKAKDQKVATFNSRLARIFDPANVDLSDYVPCHFTATELVQLRAAPPTPRLTGSEAEALKSQVIAEAVAQEQAGTLDHDGVVGFSESVAAANLEGLTPSAALAMVIAMLRATDKLSQIRQNPDLAFDLYRDNLVLGLQKLATVAPNYGPIGTDWADGLVEQLFNDGVLRARKVGINQEEAANIFEDYKHKSFKDELANAEARVALQKIREMHAKIYAKENGEVAKWSDLKAQHDQRIPQADLDRANQAAVLANTLVASAQSELDASIAKESAAQRQFEAAQDHQQQVEKAVIPLITDPQKLQAMESERNKAKAAVDAAKSEKDAATKDKTAAQAKLADAQNALNAATVQVQEARDSQTKASAADSELQKAQQSVAAVADQEKNFNKLAASGAPGSAGQSIVDQARSTIRAFKRPPDIGCAMSILSWNETRFGFGRLLANEYIAVQIVVRNLSETQEFVLHDSAFAVDTDLTGRKGRFFSGRDKLILRGMSAADADFSPRNLWVHMMESVGTIMSAVIPIAGEAFGNASSVYNSGFLQGLHKTWADHNVDHLNLLNDTAFSSTTAYKTVVPKSGSVMFVMFVPAKQFEQGWWAQACAQTISNGILPKSADPDGSEAGKKRKDQVNNLADLGFDSSNEKIEDQTGIDLERARNACMHGGGNPKPSRAAKSLHSGTTDAFDIVHYKSWSPNALAIFRELAFTIVAGVHVNEAAQNNPVITSIENCENELGNVDFTKQSGGTLSCAIKGQNLDKVQKIRLHNAATPTDSTVAEGDVKVNGDSTSATVSLPLTQIGPLEGRAYRTYPVDKNGVEGTVGPTLHFDTAPFIDSLTTSPIKIDLGKDLDSKALTKPIELSGYHLDKLSSVQLAGKDTSSNIKFAFDVTGKPTTSKASFVFGPAKEDKTGKTFTDTLNPPKKPLQLTITLNSADQVVPTVKTAIIIELSGTIPAAAPTQPAQPPPPAANGGANGGGGQNPATKPAPKKPATKPN